MVIMMMVVVVVMVMVMVMVTKMTTTSFWGVCQDLWTRSNFGLNSAIYIKTYANLCAHLECNSLNLHQNKIFFKQTTDVVYKDG
jgi:hypothetical protein